MKNNNPERINGKIKVVHCVESWLPQTMVWLYNQIKFLPEDVENFVVCHSLRNLDQFAVPNIYSLKSLPVLQQYYKKIFWKIHLRPELASHLSLLEGVINSIKPDILHSHFGHMGSINARLAKRHNLGHLVNFYGADVNYLPNKEPYWRKKYQEMSDIVDQILCEGPFMAQSIEDLGLDSSKIKIYRLGIDLEKIRFVPRKYLPNEKLRFLIAGTFREKKGVPYALEALGLFSRKNGNIEITIIGDANETEREQLEKQRILEKVKEWDLYKNVRLLGYQPYDILLKEAYEHHIFISPSVTSEDGDVEGGAPVTIIEMAASGMPIVSTTHCDIPFVLSERNKDYLVGERDSRAICEAIDRLIKSGWDELVVSNRLFIERELDIRNQSQRLYQIYLDVLNE